MCGICGVVGLESQEAATACVRRMMAAMQHRGPDGEGHFTGRRAAIGMRRLSIIDLPGGNQPIWNETGALAVICNGEIYNFRELRKELESAGHSFRTHSDTEVIVHAFEEWGEDCVSQLRGMFAFAILELSGGNSGPPRRIFLARDRLGIKPLYYASNDGVLLFASEVRALLASGQIPQRISPAAVSSYLLFGSVGEPMTLVEGIWSVPPGHRGFISCDDPAAFRPQSYWNPHEAPNREPATSEHSPAAKLKSLLKDSVRLHLEADVPLGIFLSGGVDSTALASIAASQRPGIHTFTVVFSQQEFSEAEAARRTAQRLGTQHSEFLLSGEEMSSRLDEAIGAFDQPSMDGVNTFFVSWAARQAGLKVALSGLGSDEIFGGYDTFQTVPRLAHFISYSQWLPKPIRRALSKSLESFTSRSARADAARKLAAAILQPGDFPHPYFFTRALFPPRAAAALLNASDNGNELSPWRQWLEQTASDASRLNSFNSVSWLETRSYLVNTLLRDTDTMSMRHSLEVRVPFLDHHLVEWTLTLPARIKQKNGARKALLIEALGNLLPDAIGKQPKKTFTLPWEIWLRGPLRDRVEASLSDLSPALKPVLNANAVQKIWRDFLARRTSWSRPWSLFVLNEWAKANMDAAPTFAMSEEIKAAHAVP